MIFWFYLLNAIVKRCLLLLLSYVRTFVRIIRVKWTRRTLALWLGKLAIELLTIERLRDVTRQFFVLSPPLTHIFCSFFPLAELFAPYILPFFLSRSIAILFLSISFFYLLVIYTMTFRWWWWKESDKNLEHKPNALNMRGPFRNFKSYGPLKTRKKAKSWRLLS